MRKNASIMIMEKPWKVMEFSFENCVGTLCYALCLVLWIFALVKKYLFAQFCSGKRILSYGTHFAHKIRYWNNTTHNNWSGYSWRNKEPKTKEVIIERAVTESLVCLN